MFAVPLLNFKVHFTKNKYKLMNTKFCGQEISYISILGKNVLKFMDFL